MNRPVLLFLVWLIGGLLASGIARAECGGTTQCIGVGATETDAQAAHHGGPPTFTLAFGNQSATTVSAAQTIFVAAVTGPVGTMATLGPITISGADASQFSVTGGTCSTTNGPVQGGASCTITVAFNPSSVGAKTALLTVPLNPPSFAGAITERTVTLAGTGTPSPVAPGVSAATLSVQVNASASLDLAPFITGTATGVTIAAQPSRGSVTVSGTSVTYRPVANYFGPDSLSESAFSAAGASPPAVVTVTVAGRPDPGQDAAVRGLAGAQANAAVRFTRSQIVNIQGRMERLHRGSRGGPASAGRFSSPTPSAYGQVGAAGGPSRLAGSDDRGIALAMLGTTDLHARLHATMPSMNLAGADTGLPDLPGVSRTSTDQRLGYGLLAAAQSAGSSSLNLSGLGDAGVFSTGAMDIWVGGNIRFGTRESTNGGGALPFSSDGITVGADRHINDQLALGIAVGHGRDRANIGADGSRSEGRSSTVALYGSYRPSSRTYVDAAAGYGRLESDTRRYVALANDFAVADRRGHQLFGSVSAGYEYRESAYSWSPYGRLDFGRARLNEAAETGAGANALRYGKDKVTHKQLSLGIRADGVRRTGYGWMLPRVRGEIQHDYSGAQEASVSFADLLNGPTYNVSTPVTHRNSLLFGVGSDFLLGNGLRLVLDYQTQRSRGQNKSQGLGLTLVKSLDGKGLEPVLEASAPAESTPLNLNVEAGYSHDNNVARAGDIGDVLSDSSFGLTVSKSMTMPLGSNTRLVGNASLGGEKFKNFHGLGRTKADAQVEWQYRSTGDLEVPIYGVFMRLGWDEYESDLRDGYRHSVGVSLRRFLSDRIHLFSALARNGRNAKRDVFDTWDYSARLNLDFELDNRSTVYLAGEYRRGDLVSSGRASDALRSLAKAFALDDAFADRQMSAYRIKGASVLTTLGYNLPLGSKDSLDLSWRRIRSKSLHAPDTAGYALGTGPAATPRYGTNQYSINYLLSY